VLGCPAARHGGKLGAFALGIALVVMVRCFDGSKAFFWRRGSR
jgi:hypothetical protein